MTQLIGDMQLPYCHTGGLVEVCTILVDFLERYAIER